MLLSRKNWIDLFLLFAISILLFQRCSAQTTYVIEKGANYSSPRSYSSHGSMLAMFKTVVFDSTCLYKLNTIDDSDINKLFGWGISVTSVHSVRFGWNCKSGTGIDLYAYLHYNGSRWIIPKDSSSNKLRADLIGKGFKPGLPIACGIYRSRDALTFEAVQGTRKETLVIKFFDFPDGFGFFQYPYFGGNTRAPHRMVITLK